MALRRVAAVAEVPAGRGWCVTVEGIAVGLFRVGDRIHAMEDRCPHAGLSLSEGSLNGCLIECAGHGWKYDVRTGFRPDYEDGFPIPCFEVELRGQDVYVDLERPINLRRSSSPRS